MASQKHHKPGIEKNPRSNQQYKSNVKKKKLIKFMFIIKALEKEFSTIFVVLQCSDEALTENCDLMSLNFGCKEQVTN